MRWGLTGGRWARGEPLGRCCHPRPPLSRAHGDDLETVVSGMWTPGTGFGVGAWQRSRELRPRLGATAASTQQAARAGQGSGKHSSEVRKEAKEPRRLSRHGREQA